MWTLVISVKSATGYTTLKKLKGEYSLLSHLQEILELSLGTTVDIQLWSPHLKGR